MWAACDGCNGTKANKPDPLLKQAMIDYAGTLRSVSFDIISDAQDDAIRALLSGNTPDLTANRDQAAALLRNALQDVIKFGVDNVLNNEDNILGTATVPDAAFTLAPKQAMEVLDKYTFELADDLMGTTADMAKVAVERGLADGLGAQATADLMDGIPEYRADMIAQTEINRATNEGRRVAMLAVGAKRHKSATAPGVRKAHAEIASQGTIPSDQPFVKAGDIFDGRTYPRDIYAPPFDPNCHCVVLPVFEGSE